jgi:glycosyltransferase involved in cell wall biosynthesis
VVTPSQWVAGLARQSPLLGQCVVECIPHGLDTNVFRPIPRPVARTALGVPAEANVLLFSAADPGQPRKGGPHLREALERLKARGCRGLTLLTAGAPSDADDARWPVPHRSLGRITDDHLMALCYSAADILVGPSLAETFGLVFSEAMACATPAVAFDVAAVPEVVRHMETGYLARPGDVEDLANGLRTLLEDDGLREGLGRRAREVAEREYTLGLCVQRYVQLYQRVRGEG